MCQGGISASPASPLKKTAVPEPKRSEFVQVERPSWQCSVRHNIYQFN